MKIAQIKTYNKGTLNFGMAKMSNSVTKFIIDARKICPASQKGNLEDAINIIKTSFPDKILTKTRKKFYLITQKDPQKTEKITDYKYCGTISSIKGNKVEDIRSVAGTFDFMKIGSFSNIGGYVSGRVDASKANAFKKKWSAFFLGLKQS